MNANNEINTPEYTEPVNEQKFMYLLSRKNLNPFDYKILNRAERETFKSLLYQKLKDMEKEHLRIMQMMSEVSGLQEHLATAA